MVAVCAGTHNLQVITDVVHFLAGTVVWTEGDILPVQLLVTLLLLDVIVGVSLLRPQIRDVVMFVDGLSLVFLMAAP